MIIFNLTLSRSNTNRKFSNASQMTAKDRITNKKNEIICQKEGQGALTIYLEWNPQNQEKDMTTEKIRS